MSRTRVLVMPPLCGGVGVVIVALHLPRWVGCLIALTAALRLLQAVACQIAPAVSAAVLPVVFQAGGWMYVMSVVAICGVAAGLSPRPGESLEEPGDSAVSCPTLAPAPHRAVLDRRRCVDRRRNGLPAGALDGPRAAASGVVPDWVMRRSRPPDVAVRRCGLLTIAAVLGATASGWIPFEWAAGAIAVIVVILLARVLAEPHFPAVAVALVPFVAGQRNPLIAGGAVALSAIVLYLAGGVAGLVGHRVAQAHPGASGAGGVALEVQSGGRIPCGPSH